MNPLRKLRRALLSSGGRALFPLVSRSNWRRQRLLILCYHGIAMDEEHGSHPEMFLPASVFARRMEILAQSGSRVLGLAEGIRLLRAGKLPGPTVAITFDDGWADFYPQALPVLQKHGFPATVYLTTYYCRFNRPLFRFVLAHMMWKHPSPEVANRKFPWLPERLDLSTAASRSELVRQIDEYARQRALSAQQKDELAAAFAEAIGFDYSGLCRQRGFHLMNPVEVANCARAGIDFQLHTHRHRTPLDAGRFIGEIEENRRAIAEITGSNDRVHFCYPSGAIRPDFIPWLKEAGVQTATTCITGLAGRSADPYLLPRILDQYGLADSEFAAWISGLAGFLPSRRNAPLDVAPE
ncbi:MAG TPA: polysaccharide deacetylase family protein [Candidatus Binatia bacterium]|nr:polysaccharide deacetylase family protein [Candidatus Binatia bacterium]